MSMRDRINTTRRRQFQLAGLLVVVGGAAWALAYRPMAGELGEARREMEQVKSELEYSNSRASQLPELRRRVSQLRQQVDRFKSMRPSDDFKVAYKEIGDIAQASRLRDYKFAPGQRIRIEGGAEQQIEIQCTGSFEDFVQFLGRIEQMDRLSRLRDMDVKYRDGKAGTVTAELSLSLFFSE
jgi:Tfp pilus assembly protein PilO